GSRPPAGSENSREVNCNGSICLCVLRGKERFKPHLSPSRQLSCHITQSSAGVVENQLQCIMSLRFLLKERVFLVNIDSIPMPGETVFITSKRNAQTKIQSTTLPCVR